MILGQDFFSKYKTKQDIDRESQEFEARKRLTDLQLQKAERQAMQPQAPFQGTGFDAQLVNRVYQANVAQGMDPAMAEQQAIDSVLQSKTQVDARGNVHTRQPIFGGTPAQIDQMTPQDAMGMPAQPDLTYSTPFNPDPAQAPDMALQDALDPMGVYQPTPGQMPADPVILTRPEQAPAITVPDVGGLSPYTQEDIAKETAIANIKMQRDDIKRAREAGQGHVVADNSFNSLLGEAQNIFNRVDEAIELVSPATAGLGSLTANVPGTPAADLQGALNTVQADAAFSRLQEMRDSSKTGGALGQVSERELSLLRDARVSLTQQQRPDTLKKNLNEYKRIRLNAMKNVAEAYKKDYGYYPTGFEAFTEANKPGKRGLRFNPATGRIE